MKPGVWIAADGSAKPSRALAGHGATAKVPYSFEAGIAEQLRAGEPQPQCWLPHCSLALNVYGKPLMAKQSKT